MVIGLLALSSVVHYSTFQPNRQYEPVIGALIIDCSIIVCLILALFALRENSRGEIEQSDIKPSRERILLVGSQFLARLLMFYGAFAFHSAMDLNKYSSVTQLRDGRYALFITGRSAIVQILTESEFIQHQTYYVRALVGAAIAINALTILISFSRWKTTPRQNKSIL